MERREREPIEKEETTNWRTSGLDSGDSDFDSGYGTETSCVSMRSGRSMDTPYRFRRDPMVEVEPAGVRWLTQGLRNYSCELTLDTNTVNKNLKLSDNNRKVTYVGEVQRYPDHPERFDYWPQLLCREGLTGRCYWEVKTRGTGFAIAVCYRGIRRKGSSEDGKMSGTDKSWSLECSPDGRYYVYHNKRQTSVSSPRVSNRVAVYVDWPAGSLSFYTVSSDSLIHLHTFYTTFTEPLYPGLGIWHNGIYGVSLSLCSV